MKKALLSYCTTGTFIRKGLKLLYSSTFEEKFDWAILLLKFHLSLVFVKNLELAAKKDWSFLAANLEYLDENF